MNRKKGIYEALDGNQITIFQFAAVEKFALKFLKTMAAAINSSLYLRTLNLSCYWHEQRHVQS